MATDHVRFSEPQQKALDEIVESRLNRERRLHEKAMQAERQRHAAEIRTLQIQLEQARSERSIMSGLLDRWFGSPRAESGR